MIINSGEIKQYLRIDTTNEDTLIETIKNAAISYCETALNRPILDSNMDTTNTWEVPESIRIAIYMLIAHWYENRLPIGQVTEEMAFSVNSILSPHRFRNV